MIRLPPELLRTLLETRVVRGSILRFWWDTAGKHKFGIVLNAAWPESAYDASASGRRCTGGTSERE